MWRRPWRRLLKGRRARKRRCLFRVVFALCSLIGRSGHSVHQGWLGIVQSQKSGRGIWWNVGVTRSRPCGGR